MDCSGVRTIEFANTSKKNLARWMDRELGDMVFEVWQSWCRVRIAGCARDSLETLSVREDNLLGTDSQELVGSSRQVDDAVHLGTWATSFLGSVTTHNIITSV